ncbi:MAG: biliverdin-producing heme oxygenase [Burkholderiaceae bacterium]
MNTLAARADCHSLALPRIRKATRALHLRLESRLPLLSPSLTIFEYTRLLGAFHGYYLPLESRVATIAASIPDLNWSQRTKLPLLAADLDFLGVDGAARAALPICAHLPAPANTAETLGCLYVMEGATLGGQVTSRALRGRFGLERAGGAAFFGSYGEQVGTRWRGFLSCLARIETPEHASAAARAASDAFLSLESWLSERGVLS